uniref:Uncharacterized protein n=1 Tax=Vibrio sp. 23023 TaxID=452803 RepID=A9M4R8_9VIBR|nr:Conserved hypothetical protein [Vibrio sp. 23023]
MKIRTTCVVLLSLVLAGHAAAKQYSLDPAYEANKRLRAATEKEMTKDSARTDSLPVTAETWQEIWHGSTQGLVPVRVPASAKEVYIIANGRGFTIPVNSHSTLIDGRGSYSGHVVRGAGATQTGHSGPCVHSYLVPGVGHDASSIHVCDAWANPGQKVPAVNIQSVQVKY